MWWWATGKSEGPSAGPGPEPLGRPRRGVGPRGGSGPRAPQQGVGDPGAGRGRGLAVLRERSWPGPGPGRGGRPGARGGWVAAAASCCCCRPGREARARRGRERGVRGSAGRARPRAEPRIAVGPVRRGRGGDRVFRLGAARSGRRE